MFPLLKVARKTLPGTIAVGLLLSASAAPFAIAQDPVDRVVNEADDGRCVFPQASTLPEDFIIYAAGGYTGRELDFQIDQSGHTATQMDITVNEPSKPVVLMLGAYEPTIWNIQWTEETEIAGVLVSGYHRQAIAGLPATVPLLNSSYENRGDCDYFYMTSEDYSTLNPLARLLFGQSVAMIFPLRELSGIVVGEAVEGTATLVSSDEVSIESFIDPTAPLAGQAGMDEAIAKGLLRQATKADAEAWIDAQVALMTAASDPDIPPVAGEENQTYRPPLPGIGAGYVVLDDDFVYPAGLYGANSVTFFIPEGVAVPEGNPGHSAVLNFNTLQCTGGLCDIQ